MPAARSVVTPGTHSRNAKRSAFRETDRHETRLLRRARQLLLAVGLICIGYYLYALGDQYVYQKYENWAFDQEISGRTGVTFLEYIRERMPDIFSPGIKPIEITAPPPNRAARSDTAPHLAEGDLVARV